MTLPGLIAPNTVSDLVSECRSALEDYGDNITDNQTGDGATTLWKLSSFPVKTNSELTANNGTLTVGGVQQTQVTNYTINYDNGELRFVTAPGSGVAITATYMKVVWRDERLISALNAAFGDMYNRGAYKRGEAYVLLQTLKYDYDLSSAADVAPAASFGGDFTFPAQYNPGTARADLANPQTRIHFAEYHPFGANRPWHPYHTFGRTTLSGLHIDGDPTPNDALRLTYSAPFTMLQNMSDVTDCPQALIWAPVWYALSVVMEKKEAKRSRSDSYATAQNANANPPGTQSQTAEDYLQRYLRVMDNAMRPMRMTQRRRLSGWQWTETIR